MFGFTDGTNNLKSEETAAVDEHVWVQSAEVAGGSSWMAAGSHLDAPDPHTPRGGPLPTGFWGDALFSGAGGSGPGPARRTRNLLPSIVALAEMSPIA